ncbi:helix-turn-helix transcriptional regulator [Desulfovibrio sp.]|uniref:helix-turn-helix transcriptional regulator n=1 Tax=Desulfovibrio sp. TaxID=885 RepID=UPI00345BCD0E
MLQENTKGVMRARDGAIFLGIGTSTFWKWHAEGKLPRGIRLSSRCTVWRREDLEQFLAKAAGDHA